MVPCPPQQEWRLVQGLLRHGFPRTLPCEETVLAPRELPEGADPRVQELRDRLEQELQQQGEEQYRSVLKRKEQHVTEVWDSYPHPVCTAKGFSLN